MTEKPVCRKNDILDLDIVNMGNDGEGIGRLNGYTLFVKDALAGDQVRVKVMKTKKHFGYAKLLEILVPSPDRVAPVCPVAKKCGGCQLQHCSYERQLQYKEEKVKDCLERIGGFSVVLPEAGEDKKNTVSILPEIRDEKYNLHLNMPEAGKEKKRSMEINDKNSDNLESSKIVVMELILAMEYPYYYRNKAQFPVGIDKNGKLIAGFYAGRTHRIIPNTDCAIQHPCNQRIVETILDFMSEYQILAYDEEAHSGLVRHILTRIGKKTGEIMICLVLNGKKLPYQDKLVERLLSIDFADLANTDAISVAENVQRNRGITAGKEKRGLVLSGSSENKGRENLKIKSICLNHNTEKTNVILGKEISVLYGQAYIEDEIGTVRFRISPLSFYQVNPLQTEKLYSTALEYADLRGGEIVWDLYCGIGTISLFLAQKAAKVCGVEIVPQAIEDAKVNAALNGIENAEFFCGAAEEVVPGIYKESSGTLKADVVTLDPPRKGCDEKLLETVLKMEPERIVYISCDPATLARDLKFLCQRGYALKKVRPCDMFGFSGHVECVTMLQRRDM